MKLLTILLTLAISMALVGAALAVPPGKTFEFSGMKDKDGKDVGKVVFEGKVHAGDNGLKCPDCHTKIWKMKKADNPKMTMKEMNEGKFCGTCHNGKEKELTINGAKTKKVVFSTSDSKNCGKCHKK